MLLCRCADCVHVPECSGGFKWSLHTGLSTHTSRFGFNHLAPLRNSTHHFSHHQPLNLQGPGPKATNPTAPSAELLQAVKAPQRGTGTSNPFALTCALPLAAQGRHWRGGRWLAGCGGDGAWRQGQDHDQHAQAGQQDGAIAGPAWHVPVGKGMRHPERATLRPAGRCGAVLWGAPSPPPLRGCGERTHEAWRGICHIKPVSLTLERA